MALNDDSINTDDSGLISGEKLAIILGTEGDGLVAGTIADCDCTVRIPTSHGVDSLNVVAASTVTLWQLERRQGIDRMRRGRKIWLIIHRKNIFF